jgi:hypothetical protein
LVEENGSWAEHIAGGGCQSRAGRFQIAARITCSIQVFTTAGILLLGITPPGGLGCTLESSIIPVNGDDKINQSSTRPTS